MALNEHLEQQEADGVDERGPPSSVAPSNAQNKGSQAPWRLATQLCA